MGARFTSGTRRALWWLLPGREDSLELGGPRAGFFPVGKGKRGTGLPIGAALQESAEEKGSEKRGRPAEAGPASYQWSPPGRQLESWGERSVGSLCL